MNRCARNVSEIASAIEKCISYILLLKSCNYSIVAKLISDTFLDKGRALEVQICLPLCFIIFGFDIIAVIQCIIVQGNQFSVILNM